MLELIIIATILVVAFIHSGYTKYYLVKSVPIIATSAKVTKDLSKSAYYEIQTLKLDNEELNHDAGQRAKDYNIKAAYKALLIETEKLTGTSALATSSRTRYKEAKARQEARNA